MADSLEVADKSGKMRDEYNRRVVECAIAARILAKSHRIENVRILGDVVKQFANWKAPDLDRDACEMRRHIDSASGRHRRFSMSLKRLCVPTSSASAQNKFASTKTVRWKFSVARAT